MMMVFKGDIAFESYAEKVTLFFRPKVLQS